MSIRLKCRACETAFVTSDDQVGRRVTCPKCGAEQVAPATGRACPRRVAAVGRSPPPPPAPDAAPEPSVFVAAEPPRRPGRLRKVGLGVADVACWSRASAWPSPGHPRRWWHPIPPDPVEVAGGAYLQALADGDYEAAHRLGTVDEPPAIRSFRDVRRLPDRRPHAQGVVRPDRRVPRADRREVRVRSRDRPIQGPRSPRTGGRDARRAARGQGQGRAGRDLQEDGQRRSGRHLRRGRGSGRGHGQAGRGRARPQEARPDLQAARRRCEAPAAPRCEPSWRSTTPRTARPWDALLKRPFPTLKADGPFRFERAEVIGHRARPARLARRSADRAAPDPRPVPARRDRHRLEGHLGPPPVGRARAGRRPTYPSPRRATPARRSPGEVGPVSGQHCRMSRRAVQWPLRSINAATPAQRKAKGRTIFGFHLRLGQSTG